VNKIFHWVFKINCIHENESMRYIELDTVRETIITNNFPDGIFKYVREISLFDEQPFEHYFFFKFQNHFHS